MNSGKKLGKGTFATVFESKDSPLIAVKKNEKSDNYIEILALLAIAPHPNVIRMFRFGVDEHRRYWMEMPRYSMDLHDFIYGYSGLLELQELFDMAAQIVAGLAHVHDQGWIHRDVKPDNIFVDDMACVVLADFGYATRASNRCMTIPVCAPRYRAPELSTKKFYSKEIDIFSMAVTIFELFMGKEMFKNEAEIFTRCQVTGFVPSPRHLKFRAIVGDANTALWERCLGAADQRPSVREFEAFFTNKL